MTIRVLNISFAKSWRGGERLLTQLIEATQSNEIEHHLLSVKDSPLSDFAKRSGLPGVTCRSNAVFSLRSLWQLRRYCLQHNITIIHVYDSHAHTLAFLAALLWRLPIPVIVHRQVAFVKKTGWFTRWKYSHPSIKRIIGVSPAVLQSIKDFTDPEVLIFVPVGIVLADFPPRPTQSTPPVWRIGYIAALTPEKDHMTFLAVAARCHKLGLQAEYVLIGDGSERARLEARSAELGLNHCCKFLGFRNDIIECLTNLDLLLFTSESEAFSISVLEALAANVPVVATASPGLHSIFVNSNAVALAPVADEERLAATLMSLIHDPERRQTQIAQGREFVKDYDIAMVAQRLVDIYKEVSPQTSVSTANS